MKILVRRAHISVDRPCAWGVQRSHQNGTGNAEHQVGAERTPEGPGETGGWRHMALTAVTSEPPGTAELVK